MNTQLRQLGNSVAPKFAEALAAALRAQLFVVNNEMNLLPHHYQLSFDRRKSTKARQTRLKRLSVEDKPSLQMSLFTFETSPEPFLNTSPHVSNDILTENTIYNFVYASSKRRSLLSEDETIPEEAYRFEFSRYNEILYINVSKRSGGLFALAPTLEYALAFNFPIGSGIKKIVCRLWTDTGRDIPIAWDAIELALRKYSNYHSLMDIFGHFTEPHPIFSLICHVKSLPDDPLIRFAEYFSHFKNTMFELPAEQLKQVMGLNGPVDFLEVVRDLRQLRFDVRVHETNVTIPKGMFRCCYPFTLSYDKQISVSWKNMEYGNTSLISSVCKTSS